MSSICGLSGASGGSKENNNQIALLKHLKSLFCQCNTRKTKSDKTIVFFALIKYIYWKLKHLSDQSNFNMN